MFERRSLFLESGRGAGRAARYGPERPGGPEQLPGAVSTQDQPIVGGIDAGQPFLKPVIETRGLDVEFR